MQQEEDSKTEQEVRPEVLDLIRRRAARFRLQEADRDDAIQDIYLKLRGFTFDPSKGASEETVLIRIIDRHLLKVWRSWNRQQRLVDKMKELSTTESYTVRFELIEDARAAVAELAPKDRVVCELLSKGCSLKEIARNLNASRGSVCTRIKNIRRRFERLGLQEYLGIEQEGGAA